MPDSILMRKAVREDVPVIVALLTNDFLGKNRESLDDLHVYYQAFEAIDNDKDQLLVMAEMNQELVGTLQITYTRNMSFRGSLRAVLEGVHVHDAYRNQGIGQFMVTWAIAQAKAKGCRFVQLTSHKERHNAHRFYERLGFAASHEGFKIDLQEKVQE
ncbi:MAG: GNAT family N-acetyltransferase [Alphaproteobacteria bacterium]|nr:GNAT family N-acetyltransferase [Alphaproteobacteria bacterium]